MMTDLVIDLLEGFVIITRMEIFVVSHMSVVHKDVVTQRTGAKISAILIDKVRLLMLGAATCWPGLIIFVIVVLIVLIFILLVVLLFVFLVDLGGKQWITTTTSIVAALRIQEQLQNE